MTRNSNNFENGAIYRIVATCNPYNSRTHHHGEEVLERDGATPIRWVHDDNFGHLFTKEEAQQKLLEYAREYYMEHGDAQEFESIDEVKEAYKACEIPEAEWGDFSWWKGAGFYHQEVPVFLVGDWKYEQDVMTWSIEEAEGRWAVRDYEAGNVLNAENETYKDAQEVVKRYEEEDKKNGCYEEDFYEIVWLNEISTRGRIGYKIKELREKKGLSQLQLAELTGFKQPNIARLEAGAYAANLDTLDKIAKALGCDVELIEREEEE
jgi:DNA-binding XRE family transcriptional regulator